MTAETVAKLVNGAKRYEPETEPDRTPAPQRLKWKELAKKKAPKRFWFVPGWIGTGAMFCAGGGGMGKSTLLQQLLTRGAIGQALFASVPSPINSLFLNCEDPHDDLWLRQEEICEADGIDMESLDGRFDLESRYGCDNVLMEELQGKLLTTPFYKDLRERVNDERRDLLVLDNAAHVFLGDHDNRTQVTVFINALVGLVTGRPFSVVIVGHPGKAIGSEYSGSVAWENAVRMRWLLSNRLPDQPVEAGDDDPADRSKVRFLCKRKSNYSAQDFVRFTMNNGLLVPDHQPQDSVGGMVAALDEKRAEEVCIAGFKALRAMGLLPSDAKQAQDYLPKNIVQKRLNAGYSAKDLAKAMNRLMTAGTFTRGPVGFYSNRSERMGLVLKEDAQ